jgi:PAS domain S-box-containing protein
MTAPGPDDQFGTQSPGVEFLFEQTTDCIVEGTIQDGDPIVHRVNDAFESVFGYTTSELRGENLNDFITLEGKRDEVETVDQAIREGDIGPREVTRQTVDGPRDFLLRATGGKSERSYAIYTDITAQKERERELRRFKRAVEATGHVVFITSSDGTIEYVNPAFEEVTGYSADEAVGETPRILNSGEMSEEYFENLWTTILAGETWSESLVNRRKSGELYHASQTIAPIVVDGDVTAFVAIQTDITERKEREEELRETKRTLEQSNEKLDQFAGIVSHDLRNPLNVIKGRAELLRPEAPEEHVEPIERNVERMETMIDDLLTLSRAGESVDDPEPVSLTTVVADSWAAVSSDDIELEVDIPGDVEVEADGDRLRHVFENLFRNASEHNEPPVTIRVGTLSGETGPISGFFIADDGAGIPASERAEVFEYGYTTNRDGTGIGLSIVEEIVEAHGWTISVTESDAGGVRFDVHMTGQS